MKGKRFKEEQIVRILQEAEAGATVADLCRKHNCSEQSFYRWKSKYGGMEVSDVSEKAWDRARRPKLCHLALNGCLRRIVLLKLAQDWSPEQITGWHKRRCPDDQTMHVSHETIYKSLFVQSLGVLK